MCVGRILDQPQAFLGRPLLQLRNAARHDATNMHDNQTGSLGSQLLLKIFRSDTKGFGVHVHENRTSSGMNDSSRRGKKGVGGNQDILAFDVQRAKNDFERTGAAVDGDRVWSSAELGELLLEFGSVFPERQVA